MGAWVGMGNEREPNDAHKEGGRTAPHRGQLGGGAKDAKGLGVGKVRGGGVGQVVLCARACVRVCVVVFFLGGGRGSERSHAHTAAAPRAPAPLNPRSGPRPARPPARPSPARWLHHTLRGGVGRGVAIAQALAHDLDRARPPTAPTRQQHDQGLLPRARCGDGLRHRPLEEAGGHLGHARGLGPFTVWLLNEPRAGWLGWRWCCKRARRGGAGCRLVPAANVKAARNVPSCILSNAPARHRRAAAAARQAWGAAAAAPLQAWRPAPAFGRCPAAFCAPLTQQQGVTS